MPRNPMIPAALIAASLITSATSAADYALDPSHSQVVFKVGHMGYSTTFGTFGKLDGKASADWANPAASTVEVDIDAASIDSNWEARDEHLRKGDFFNVAKFPIIHFKSTKIEVTGDNAAKITGDVTLLGVTRPVVLDATLTHRAPHPYTKKDAFGINATATLKRSDFGMNFGIPMIGDEVTLEISAEYSAAD